MTPHRLTSLEIAAIVAVVMIWGVNNAGAKLMTEHMPPLMSGALRFLVAGLCLLPFVRPPYPNWKSLLIIVCVGGPVHYGLIYTAFWLAHDVSGVAVATQLWVPFTALFAFLLLGEHLNRWALVGMALSFIGVTWMTLDPVALREWPAIVVGICGAAAWALVTVIARRTTAVPPLKMQGLLALTALPALALGSLAFEHGQVEAARTASPMVWIAVLWGGIASSVVATTLMFWLVQRREAGRVTPYLLGTPVVSIIIGALWMGDELTAQILAGAALTMGGVVVVALAERGLRAAGARG